MNLLPVYRTPSKPLPTWLCEVLAVLILPPMIGAMIVLQTWKRLTGRLA